MAYNTGNAVGSTSPKDLSDNSRNLDLLVLGPNSSYPDRKGVPRKSWKGMEGEHNADQIRREAEFDSDQSRRESEHDADQARRESEFDVDQDNREAQFNTFMDASGYEPPIPYAAGILLDRTTKTVTYLGNEYRAKGSFIPMTTSNWATDEAKLKLIGDDSLRQDLSTSAGWSAFAKSVKDASAFFASALGFVPGDRVTARSGEVWDIVAAGGGEFNHPVSGSGLICVTRPDGWMLASSYNVDRLNTAAVNLAGIQLGLTKLISRGAGTLVLPAGSLQVGGRITIPAGVGLRGSAWNQTILSFTTVDGGIVWGSGSILEDVDLRGNNIAQDGLKELASFNRVSGRRVRIQDFTRYGLAIGMNAQGNNSTLEDFQVKFCGEACIALGQALNMTLIGMNTDLAVDAPVTSRGLKVFDLFPAGDSNQLCRNTKFIGGIFERGTVDFQVEVERAAGLAFYKCEFNAGAGTGGACKISKGTVEFFGFHGTLNGTSSMIQAEDAADVRVYSLTYSGSEGRALSEMVTGPVVIDGSIGKRTLAKNMRNATTSLSGVCTATKDATLGTRIVSASGGSTNRASVFTTDGTTVAGKPRVYRVEIAVSAITSGVVKAYLSVGGSPFRILLGTLVVGYNSFSTVSDLASGGSVEFIGDAAFDITLLTVSSMSY